MDLRVNNGLERINEFIQKLIINLRRYLSFRVPKNYQPTFPGRRIPKRDELSHQTKAIYHKKQWSAGGTSCCQLLF